MYKLYIISGSNSKTRLDLLILLLIFGTYGFIVISVLCSFKFEYNFEITMELFDYPVIDIVVLPNGQ